MIKQNVKELWYLATPAKSADNTVEVQEKRDDASQESSRRWKCKLDVRKMEGEWWTHSFWDTVGR